MSKLIYYKDSEANDTSIWFTHSIPILKYSDGLKFMCDKLGGYWILDTIASHLLALDKQMKALSVEYPVYVVVELRAPIEDEDGFSRRGCQFRIETNEEEVITKQDIPYTNLNENVLVYLEPNYDNKEGKEWLACLYSER